MDVVGVTYGHAVMIMHEPPLEQIYAPGMGHHASQKQYFVHCLTKLSNLMSPHAECKELYLGNKDIEKIRGFEEFVNLEFLSINKNMLKKINNLDANFRMKVLHAQDNQICTLKGSLECFRNLEQLDLSNNELRDLAKLLPGLQRFQFLTHLNLKGNPCCEEPDYRLQVVHAMPGLRVLDQHVITTAERLKAKANIGGDVAALTVAFGKRAPPRELEKVPERSLLERELAKVSLSLEGTEAGGNSLVMASKFDNFYSFLSLLLSLSHSLSNIPCLN